MRGFEIIHNTLQRHTLVEGGNAFPDVGTIHIDEIEPTLQAIAKLLDMPNVTNQVLGSVGKSEYSGDIDIAVDLNSDEMKEVSAKLRKKLGQQSVTGVAGNVTFRVSIVNYDKTKDGRQPRTGKVQVDLLPSEPQWAQVFFHSPGDTSKYKGLHRNLALSAVAGMIDRKESKETDQWGKPVNVDRWSWGQKYGLQKIRKVGIKNSRTGEWIKRKDVVRLSDPVKDPDEIAKILFRGKAGAEALNSIESVIDAVKIAYNKKEAEEIFKAMTRSMDERGLIAGESTPPELEKYLQ